MDEVRFETGFVAHRSQSQSIRHTKVYRKLVGHEIVNDSVAFFILPLNASRDVRSKSTLYSYIVIKMQKKYWLTKQNS